MVEQAVARGAPIPPGPFVPTWDSIKSNYSVPDWLRDAKFGIMMHWGIYSVPAHGSEWYEKHMYGNPAMTRWHTEHFGPPDKFGYKDFIPMFTCSNWDPNAWAKLFHQAGARYVVLTAEHHDGFALWDSAVNPWNSVALGPHRDLVGDLAKAVRKRGLKFGVSNHGMEHFTFIQPTPGLKTDLYDPKWAGFYDVADRTPAACGRFLENWVAQNEELIDKYQPDILWFDNAVNLRRLDPLKLKVAAYYYNRATHWGKQVSLSTKDDAYLYGSFKDYERASRMPGQITDFPWEVDQPVLYRFGYTKDSSIASADGCIRVLVDATSRNGSLLLNISPRADGTIPRRQQNLLRHIGDWLHLNGEAIYATRPWKQSGEGDGRDGIRFTTKGSALYAISFAWPPNDLVIRSLASTNVTGRIQNVTLLGHEGQLKFSQDAGGLKIQLPPEKPCDYAWAFKITGLKLP